MYWACKSIEISSEWPSIDCVDTHGVVFQIPHLAWITGTEREYLVPFGPCHLGAGAWEGVFCFLH
jgi:hypothetical protein